MYISYIKSERRSYEQFITLYGEHKRTLVRSATSFYRLLITMRLLIFAGLLALVAARSVPQYPDHCRHVCFLGCPYGLKLDDTGCPLCECYYPPPAVQIGQNTIPEDCPPVCLIHCPYGNVRDSNGCPVCDCNPPPPVGQTGIAGPPPPLPVF